QAARRQQDRRDVTWKMEAIAVAKVSKFRFRKATLVAAGMIVMAVALPAQAVEGKQVYKSPDLEGLPYSAAVKAGDTIYVSGVTGHVRGKPDPVAGGVQAEAEQALSHIRDILKSAGSSMD